MKKENKVIDRQATPNQFGGEPFYTENNIVTKHSNIFSTQKIFTIFTLEEQDLWDALEFEKLDNEMKMNKYSLDFLGFNAEFKVYEVVVGDD